MVESSVDNLDQMLSEEERLKLLGRTKMNLPRELKTIDEMINDRKLILGENSELFSSPSQQEQSRMLNKVRPNNRIEFQIF
jgi:hypothetical protein